MVLVVSRAGRLIRAPSSMINPNYLPMGVHCSVAYKISYFSIFCLRWIVTIHKQYQTVYGMKMHRVYGYLIGRLIPLTTLSSRFCSFVPLSSKSMQRTDFYLIIHYVMLNIWSLYITVWLLSIPILLLLNNLGIGITYSTCAPSRG